MVNGSPTKTQILDEQKGRTQLANLTMSGIVLLVVLFFTAALTDMPKSVLAAIVFLIGIDLIDVRGLRQIATRRRSEFVIALMTAAVVCVIGVEQGIISAIVVSMFEVMRRHYKPKDYVVSVSPGGEESYTPAQAGIQSEPGLIIFRYDSDLFYANTNRFIDDVEALIDTAPDPVRWLILDAKSVDDIDYSAGVYVAGLLDYLEARHVTCALSGADPSLIDTLRAYDLLDRIGTDHVYDSLPKHSTPSTTTQPAADSRAGVLRREAAQPEPRGQSR